MINSNKAPNIFMQVGGLVQVKPILKNWLAKFKTAMLHKKMLHKSNRLFLSHQIGQLSGNKDD